MAVTLSLDRTPLVPETGRKGTSKVVRGLEQREEAGISQEWADSRLVV